eukprot:ANDGO_02446.mRNA.1 3'5' exonuclease domain containing protein
MNQTRRLRNSNAGNQPYADAAYREILVADEFFRHLYDHPDMRTVVVRELTSIFDYWKHHEHFSDVSWSDVRRWWTRAHKIRPETEEGLLTWETDCWSMFESQPLIEHITEMGDAISAVDTLRASPWSVVAVDCEGVNLGQPGGDLCLIQMCTSDVQVFVFNVWERPEIFQEVKCILEDPSILKVFHGCRSDIRALSHAPFSATVQNYVDTQILYRHCFENSEAARANVGLAEMCRNLQCGEHPLKPFFDEVMRRCNNVFARSPIPVSLVQYAGLDVWFLYRAFSVMGQSFPDVLRQFIQQDVQYHFLMSIPLPAADLNALRPASRTPALQPSAASASSRASRSSRSSRAPTASNTLSASNASGVSSSSDRNVSSLTIGNLSRFDAAFQEVRQFGCPACTFTWWKMVDGKKPVSRCRKCCIRYDAVPVDVQFGYGLFECSNCRHRWTNTNSRSNVLQPCFRCGTPTKLTKFKTKPVVFDAPRSGYKHQCAGCPTGACRFIFTPSTPHDSTGSTIESAGPSAIITEFDCYDSMDAVSRAIAKLSGMRVA